MEPTSLAEKDHTFARGEIAPLVAVSLISALRLLGIFLILPIFSAYVVRYPGATVTLAGVAFGIYALTQSIFQIPLGWASDRWGRRPVLVVGLGLFALGSVACGLAQNVVQLIVARAIQGSGAVGSVALAALADLTRPSVRTQAFTITGIAIGSAFMIGVLAGPLLAASVGLDGLFYILAGLAFLAMILAATCFPRSRRPEEQQAAMPVRPILVNGELRPIFIAAFVLSFALSFFFFTYPLSWTDLGVDKTHLWAVYLVIFIPSVLLVFPYVRQAEKRGSFRFPVLIGWLTVAIAYGVYLVVALGQGAYLSGAHARLLLYITGGAFFFGYSLYQPLLPAFVTRLIPSAGRGTATGLYTFFGFIGSALGGMLGGKLIDIASWLPEAFGVVLLIVWYLTGLPKPPAAEGGLQYSA